MRLFSRPKRKTDSTERRTTALSLIYVLMGFFIIVRLFFLQVIEFKYYNALASGQHDILEQLIPKRGEIYAQTETGLYPLAINRTSYIVKAIPSQIEDPEETAKILLPWLKELRERGTKTEDEKIEQLLDIKALIEKNDGTSSPVLDEADNIDPELEKLIDKLKVKPDVYELYLLKGVNKDDLKIFTENEIKGIYWTPLASRYYPDKNIGSHLIGFFSYLSDDQKGQYGLEGNWDDLLRGRSGIFRGKKDAVGSEISIAPRTLHQASNGADLILTIEPAIQYTACTKLQQQVEKLEAVGGSVVILDPDTGRILAICAYPDYDPNLYNKVESIGVFTNPVISHAYEPGSIMKPITMAAGLDSGAVEPDDTYYDEGEIKIAGYTIRNSDFKSHGTQTMVDILEKSLNTGAIYVVEKTGTELFRKYLDDFGFGKKTGVELAGEVSGNLSALDRKGFIQAATASYGHGLTVTPLQMAAAFIPIANGGTYYQPYIIDQIIYSDGREKNFEPKSVRQIISAKTSALLSGMLVSVVKNGQASKAGVEGYLVAGKTGTAFIAGPDGRYTNQTIQSFVGFAPVEHPRFVMLVKLDQPKVKFATQSAAPLFGEIADFILKYYHVPPSELK